MKENVTLRFLKKGLVQKGSTREVLEWFLGFCDLSASLLRSVF